MKFLSHICVLIIGMLIGWRLLGAHTSGTQPAAAIANAPPASSPAPAKCPTEPPQPKTSEQKPTETKPNAKQRLAGLMDEYWKEFNNGDFDRAKGIVEDMGRISKDSKEYNEGLTRVLVRTREYEEAKPALEHCLQLFPKSKSCLTDSADVALQIGTRDEQLQAAQKCLSIMPNYPQCLNDLAIVRMHEGNFAEAVSIYEELMRTNGSFGFRFNWEMLHSQLGYALEGAGRIREAAEQFNIACRSNWTGACSKYEKLSQQL